VDISDTWLGLDQGDLKVPAHAVSVICPSSPVDIYYLFVITRVLKTKSRRTWSRENVNKGKMKESAEPALLNARNVAGTRALERPSWLPGIPNALATMPETFGVCQQFRLRIWLRLLSLSAARVSVRCHLPHSTLLYSTLLDSNPQSVVNFLDWLLVRGIADWFGVGFSRGMCTYSCVGDMKRNHKCDKPGS